ncbi:MAG: PQQ-binding-like beta-propeller repeat protein [Caldisericia bacterium]|nr:PQQ-binding-like beta-propeller repeat protein [Caldisericia bacterium]
MKKVILMPLIVILIMSFAGCGNQVVEKINIPKYDPNKKTDQVVETNSTTTSTNPDDLTEPAFPTATPATEWTMFRRTPDNMGMVDADIKLPLKKGKDEYRFMSFGAPTSNIIYGSPTVTRSNLYFGCQLGFLSCYNFETSEPKWKNSEQFDNGSGPVTSTLAANESMVFFGTGQGNLYAYDLFGDIKMWGFKTGKNISAPPDTQAGDIIGNGLIIGGPKVVGDKIYFGSFDGKIYCLKAKDGKEIWNFPTKSKIYASPAIADNKLYFSNFGGQIICLSADSGKEIWTTALPKGTLGSPIVFGSRLWVGCKNSKLYCLNTNNGKILWDYQAPDNDFGIESCPIIDEKYVYGTTAGGVTFALDRKTGEQLWQSQTSKTSLLADPLIVRDYLICADKDGVLYIIDKKTGKDLDKYYTNTVSTVGSANRCIGSSPIIIGNEIIFSSYDSNVYIVRGQ